MSSIWVTAQLNEFVDKVKDIRILKVTIDKLATGDEYANLK